MISHLITALQKSGLDVTAEEIADILWLSLKMGEMDTSDPTTILDEVEPKQPDTRTPLNSSSTDTLHSASQASNKFFHGRLPFRIPAASALPGYLSLERALSPLRRKVPSQSAFKLNKDLASQNIAEISFWIPVLEPTSTRWFEVALVVDSQSSMAIWQRTIAELQGLLERHGAFRDVRIWKLVIDNDAQAVLYAGASQQARSPRELIDPTGRRLILVVTDCISPAWYSGTIQQILNMWGRSNLVTLLQLLPQQLWSRTALRTADTVFICKSTSNISTTKLKIIKSKQRLDGNLIYESEQAVAFPIITLENQSFTDWSQVIAEVENAKTLGVVFNPQFIDSTHEALLAVEEERLSAVERMKRFRAIASPMARKLATFLAATPVNLPIIRLIQQTMLPESSQVHLAEVMFSGLLEKLPQYEEANNPDDVEYDFAAGIRDQLLNSFPIPDIRQVLKEVSDFIESRGDQSLDFQAILANPLSIEEVLLDEAYRPFVTVVAAVLRRIGGDYTSLQHFLQKDI